MGRNRERGWDGERVGDIKKKGEGGRRKDEGMIDRTGGPISS